MPPFRDLTGQRFGRLVVLHRVENRVFNNGYTKVQWRCLCDCGTELDVLSNAMLTGNTTSCGCFRSESVTAHKTTHGMTHTRLYRIWGNMCNRCNNPKDKFYKDYGGRGIKVCDEWRHNSTAFLEWAMANGYADDLTIDRIDNDGDYCPENCRWATLKEQANNKRKLTITYNGETHSTVEWAKITGLHLSTIHRRIKKGWTTEEVLKTR